jgi:hypothetical protein
MPRATILPVMMMAAAVQLAAVAASHAQDRYGPASPAAVQAAEAAPAATPARPHFLSWPGKAAPTNAAGAAPVAGAAPAQAAKPQNALANPGYKTLSSYRAIPARADSARAPLHPLYAHTSFAPTKIPSPAAAAPVLAGTPQAAPTSIYAPAPPRQAATAASAAVSPSAQAAPQAAAQAAPPAAARAVAGDQKVRFYSLHRQYGLQPDPAPIPPQFFSTSADLAEPPGPIPTQRLTSGSGASTTTRTIRGSDSSDASSGQQ